MAHRSNARAYAQPVRRLKARDIAKLAGVTTQAVQRARLRGQLTGIRWRQSPFYDYEATEALRWIRKRIEGKGNGRGIRPGSPRAIRAAQALADFVRLATE